LVGVPLLIITIVSAAAAWWFIVVRASGPIPHTFTKGIQYTLYYPTQLPAGYHVDPASFQRAGDVLIYSIKAPGGRTVAVAEQTKPADAPVHDTSSKPVTLPGERSFDTTIGKAYISLWGSRYVSDITTPSGTWVILNVTGFTTDEAVKVTQSFTEL